MDAKKPLPAPDATYATPAVAEIVAGYFEAKTSQDPERMMRFYDRELTSHNDGVIGWRLPDWETLRGLFAQYMPGWGDGRAYALRVFGDEKSAVVFVKNDPQLFGGEMRTISAVDFTDGKVSRFVDYWDARHFGTRAADGLAKPREEWPATFGEDEVPENAAPEMRDLVGRLAGALAEGRADDAAALFTEDAVLEDFALRVEVRGKAAVGRYLGRAVGTLPYGPGSAVRHVVGSARGGGYEWVNARGPVPMGITALGVDGDGLIERFATVWDGALLDDDGLAAATRRAIDPREE